MYAVTLTIRLCAARRTGPFSRTGAVGALRRAGTAVRSVNEADSIYYMKQDEFQYGANMSRAVGYSL